MKLKILIYFLLAAVLSVVLLIATDEFYDQTMTEQVVVDSQNDAENQALTTASLKAPTDISGFDWSLPKNIKPEYNSGLIDEDDPDLDYVKNAFVIVRWDDANPRENKYNFSKFEKRLSSLAPKKVLVRLEVHSVCETPKWALKQLTSSDDKSLIYWDKNYVKLLKPFIAEFANRYANDSQVMGVQLGIADGEYKGSCDNFDNKDGWGEFWMSPQSIATAEKKFGFNPDVFEQKTKEIIDIYTDTFGSNSKKLAFTNLGAIFSWGEISEPYHKKFKNIAQYVLDKGIGSRDGHIEIWMRFIDPIFGEKITSMPDGTCRLDFDEAYANKIRGRYWGTENEFYGKGFVLDVHGPYENQPYRFLISSLRALQMRRNHFTISGGAMKKMTHPVYKTQAFLPYLTKVFGKQIENTPDAFVLLGERYVAKDHIYNFSDEPCVKESKNGVAIRSFGRWLTEKSNSKPAMKVSMPANENYWAQDYYLPDGVDFEYSARKARQFDFDINDHLSKQRCKTACTVEIKATFKDTAKMVLNIMTAEGNTQNFTTLGDNKIKTVTFTVKSIFRNRFNGNDFSLKSNNAEIPLIMTRVNFL